MKLTSILTLVVAFATISCAPKSEHQGHHGNASARNYADSVNTGIIPVDTLKGSTMRIAMEYVGKNHVHIEYGSPGVRGRTIWGGLVALDQVWASGAHRATSVEFSQDVIVGNQAIPAGKYAFFTIPSKDQWTLIINKNWDQHLADEYKESEDLVRIPVIPDPLTAPVQRLTYSVNKLSDQEGEIILEWELIRVRMPFKNK